MRIGNKEYTGSDILRRSGNPGSHYGARRMTLTDGKGAGMRVR